MNKHLKTVDWFILVTAALDILVFLLILLVPSCNRSEPRFVQPEAEIVDSDEDVSQAMTVGESGQLKITLLWDFPGDIDLHVEQPNGREIYYKRSRDYRTGGYLDVDNRVGGSNSAENIYWSSPIPGNYKVFLKYYSASTASNVAESGVCRVVVFQEGVQTRTFNVEMSSVGQEKYVTTVRL